MLALLNTRWSSHKYTPIYLYNLALLASVLRDKYDVKILDANLENLSLEEVSERVNQYKPDIFGITCMSFENDSDLHRMVSSVKLGYKKTKVIAGGIHPTLLPEVVMQDKNIDYAILGEGEYRLPKLLDHLKHKASLEQIDGLAYRVNNEIIVQKVENYIQNLDDLPFPSYDLLDFDSYANNPNKYSPFNVARNLPYVFMTTSRGCPFKCIFCSSEEISGPVARFRSPNSVLGEIDWLVENYGVKEIIFQDDNLFLNRKRTKKILEGIIERNYDLEWKPSSAAVYTLNDEILELAREAGCYQLPLAFEAGSIESLKLLKKPSGTFTKAKPVVKKAKSLGFDLIGMFVFGVPGETWDNIRQTFKFAEELDLDYCSFNIATPLPKTELYKIAKQNNLCPEDFSFDSRSFKGFGKGTITTNEFTPEELQILRSYEWDRINFKNKDKIDKIAKMCRLTLEEIDEWRIYTRRGHGIRERK